VCSSDLKRLQTSQIGDYVHLSQPVTGYIAFPRENIEDVPVQGKVERVALLQIAPCWNQGVRARINWQDTPFYQRISS